MTIFRQSRRNPKASKGVKLPGFLSGSNETGSDQSTSTSISIPTVYEHNSDSTRQFIIPTRGDSMDSMGSNDSGMSSSSSSATSTNSSTCSINGPIGVQGAIVRITPNNETTCVRMPTADTPLSSALTTSQTISSRRPSLVGPAPSESGTNDPAMPQVSRYGRLFPSTHEIRGQGATIPCLAYSTPRPVVASEDYGSPPPYDAIFGLNTHDAVFRTSTRQGLTL